MVPFSVEFTHSGLTMTLEGDYYPPEPETANEPGSPAEVDLYHIYVGDYEITGIVSEEIYRAAVKFVEKEANKYNGQD